MARLTSYSVVFGPRPWHGGTDRHGTAKLSCHIVSCLSVLVLCRAVRPGWPRIFLAEPFSTSRTLLHNYVQLTFHASSYAAAPEATHRSASAALLRPIHGTPPPAAREPRTRPC
jgi:hypothetical protein